MAHLLLYQVVEAQIDCHLCVFRKKGVTNEGETILLIENSQLNHDLRTVSPCDGLAPGSTGEKCLRCATKRKACMVSHGSSSFHQVVTTPHSPEISDGGDRRSCMAAGKSRFRIDWVLVERTFNDQ